MQSGNEILAYIYIGKDSNNSDEIGLDLGE